MLRAINGFALMGNRSMAPPPLTARSTDTNSVVGTKQSKWNQKNMDNGGKDL